LPGGQRSRAQDRNANALRRIRLKNAKKEASERQRRGEGVPINVSTVNTTGPEASLTSAETSGAPTFGPMPGVNPAGLSPGGDTTRPSSGVAARRTADGACGRRLSAVGFTWCLPTPRGKRYSFLTSQGLVPCLHWASLMRLQRGQLARVERRSRAGAPAASGRARGSSTAAR
jgi:hypothetical protein